MGKERGSYGQLAASGALQPDFRLALTSHVNDWSGLAFSTKARENVDAVFATVVCASTVNCRRKLNARLQSPVRGDSPTNRATHLLLRKQQGPPIQLNAYPEKNIRGADVRALRRRAARLFRWLRSSFRGVVGVCVWQPRSSGAVHYARCAVPIQGNGH